MAPKKPADAVALTNAKLKSLTIKNFRGIGNNAVTVELDDIVVLVGPNNVGKSSILRAYEVVMRDGSTEGQLQLDDFPNGQVTEHAKPEIVLVTAVGDEAPGLDWIDGTGTENLVKERWTWSAPGKPKRQGWNVKTQDWDEKVPWGAPNVANARRPEPHRVSAFDAPETQAAEISKILLAVLEDRLSAMDADDEAGDPKPYRKLMGDMKTLRKAVVDEATSDIAAVEKQISDGIQRVFPGFVVKLDAKPEQELAKFKLWGTPPELRMGPSDGFLTSIDKQGSGARRTLLWNALRVAAEGGATAKGSGRPHVLLIDEPEICLHPNAVREACATLYDLPKSGNWQVMATTHSPVFIDLSRDNTKIIRVSRTKEGDVTSTTLYRASDAKLGADDKENLKLLNLCDPHVAEFFFGGRTIVVEGDTEYTAFSYLRSEYPDDFRDIHVVRARGKATIVSLAKVLNHFGSDYAILHDSDTEFLDGAAKNDGTPKKNPAWAHNEKIQSVTSAAGGKATVVASVPNFEKAYFGEDAKEEKPYTALQRLRADEDFAGRVLSLLRYLAQGTGALPPGAVAWSKAEELREGLS